MIPIFHGQNRNVFYPPQYDHLKMWINADVGNYTLSGSNVIFIKDLTGISSGGVLSYSSGAYATIEPSRMGANNKQALSFPAGSDYAVSIINLLAGSYEAVGVFQYDNSTHFIPNNEPINVLRKLPGSTYDTVNFSLLGDNNLKKWGVYRINLGGNERVFSTHAMIPGESRIMHYQDHNLYSNGAEDPYYSQDTISTAVQIGRIGNDNDPAYDNDTKLYVGEILIYDIELSVAERLEVDTYLNNKYDIY